MLTLNQIMKFSSSWTISCFIKQICMQKQSQSHNKINAAQRDDRLQALLSILISMFSCIFHLYVVDDSYKRVVCVRNEVTPLRSRKGKTMNLTTCREAYYKHSWHRLKSWSEKIYGDERDIVTWYEGHERVGSLDPSQSLLILALYTNSTCMLIYHNGLSQTHHLPTPCTDVLCFTTYPFRFSSSLLLHLGWPRRPRNLPPLYWPGSLEVQHPILMRFLDWLATPAKTGTELPRVSTAVCVSHDATTSDAAVSDCNQCNCATLSQSKWRVSPGVKASDRRMYANFCSECNCNLISWDFTSASHQRGDANPAAESRWSVLWGRSCKLTVGKVGDCI